MRCTINVSGSLRTGGDEKKLELVKSVVPLLLPIMIHEMGVVGARFAGSDNGSGWAGLGIVVSCRGRPGFWAEDSLGYNHQSISHVFNNNIPYSIDILHYRSHRGY